MKKSPSLRLMLRHRQRMRESSTLPSPPSCPTISVATRTADNELLRNARLRSTSSERRSVPRVSQWRPHAIRPRHAPTVRPYPQSAVPQRALRCNDVFSSERAFYYAQKGDQLISPEQQAEITTIFNEYELPAPQFDSYEQRPDWEQWHIQHVQGGQHRTNESIQRTKSFRNSTAEILHPRCSLTAEALQKHCSTHAVTLQGLCRRTARRMQ